MYMVMMIVRGDSKRGEVVLLDLGKGGFVPCS